MRNFKVCATHRFGVTTSISFAMEKEYCHTRPEITVTILKSEDTGKWTSPTTTIHSNHILSLADLTDYLEELEIVTRLVELLTLHCTGWPNINCRDVHWLYTDMNFENSILNMLYIS